MNSNSTQIIPAPYVNYLDGSAARYQSNLIGGRRRKSRTVRKNNKSSIRTGKKSRGRGLSRSHRKRKSVKFMVPLF